MITLDLAADQEFYLQQQAAERGLSVNTYAAQLLANCCELLRPKPANDATRALRQQAVERLIRASSRPDAPRLNLPEGVTLREYIHEGHRY